MSIDTEKFLSATEDIICKSVCSISTEGFLPTIHEKLADISCYALFSKNSKRARPLLCLAYYNLLFSKQGIKELAEIAAACELIHGASLLHDDVIDHAHKRRGQETINALYGNTVGVLSGNFLLTKALEILSGFSKNIYLEAIKVVESMSIACMKEVFLRKKVDVTFQDWKEVALGKTAKLFTFCGFCVAEISSQSTQKKYLEDASKFIGYLFQLMDDLKDFSGDNCLKTSCSDIKNQEASLPIILAIAKSQKNYQIFQKVFSQDFVPDSDVKVLKDIVLKSGAIEDTQKIALGFKEEINKILKVFPQNEGSLYIETWLKKLTTNS